MAAAGNRAVTALVVAAGVVYLAFALSNVRLAVVYDDDVALSVGEALFTLVGAVAFFVAALRPTHGALIVLLGTLPLVGWFVATPSNSGPPFLIASLVAPVLAAATLLRPGR